MKTMTSCNDRTRLKDRILANVAKAIKSIQECQILRGEESIVLANTDWQCHKLCEHIDHAFLHGLRHVTNGYWRVVTDFTRKGAVKEIKGLKNVTTDLGRGRAWLYVALNESLLESYMRCFMENSRYVKKYYVKEALVLDQQRLNVLITLTSGLDFATFTLEYDLPYLDLSSHPARPRTESRTSSQDEEKVSLCSMESSSSYVSSLMSTSLISTSESLRGYHDNDSFSSERTNSASTDSGYQVDVGNGLRTQRMMSLPNESSTIRSASPYSETSTRLNRIEMVVNVSDREDEDSFEVIRVKSKGDKQKKKKKKPKKTPVAQNNVEVGINKGNGSLNELHNTTDSPVSNSPSKGGSPEDTPTSDDWNSDVFGSQSEQTQGLSLPNICNSTPVLKSPSQGGSATILLKEDSGYSICEETVDPAEEACSSIYRYADNADKLTKNKISLEQHVIQAQTGLMRGEINKLDTISPSAVNDSALKDKKSKPDAPPSSQEMGRTLENKNVLNPKESSSSQNDCQIYDGGIAGNLGVSNENHSDSMTDSLSSDIDATSIVPSKTEYMYLTPPLDVDSSDEMHDDATSMQNDGDEFGVRDIDQTDHCFLDGAVSLTDCVEDDEEGLDEECLDKDCDLHVDNNTMLYLMLDVFEQEDEQYSKLFSTRCGHTEGETTVIFLLVTDRTLYLLRRKKTDHTFIKDAVISYKELDYISLSLNEQVIQTVCTNRRKQFWICTGDRLLTRSVLSCVSEAMGKSEDSLPKLTVLTDATTQKIAMRKYAAKECHVENAQTIQIHSYVLVHWEDPSSRQGKGESANKEGHLLYRAKAESGSLFGSSAWKTAYVMLRDGVFCVFNDKSDNKPHTFINLSSEDCTGCRRLQLPDRKHCLEIVSNKGSSLQVAAANNQEASDWLLVLCQAVSEGRQPSQAAARSLTCLPCCLVLTQYKLLMCHEDVQTSFFRTLGSANIVDVTAITEDPFVKTYCVLEFESQEDGVSSEQWVLYFNAANERIAFIEAFSAVWAQEFQVDVPVVTINDIPLQTKCREVANHLRESLRLKP